MSDFDRHALALWLAFLAVIGLLYVAAILVGLAITGGRW